MAQISPSSTEGLPKHFVDAMHTLFDIMDDQNLGYVKLSDIEERWQDDGSQNMPKNVLESLKKVTPPNGTQSHQFSTFLVPISTYMQIKNRWIIQIGPYVQIISIQQRSNQ